MQDYLACVQGVDDSIGKVLDYLEETDLAKNTIVFYSADNGFYLGDLGLFDKRFMYEPGLRVPLVVKGPGIKAGGVPEQFVLNIDLAPTFLEFAGEPVPNWMQGRSLVPLIHGESPIDWRTSMYYRYCHDPGHHNTRAHLGLRTATHKLIYYWKKDAWEMFDLTKDPTEQHNLIADPSQTERIAELKRELTRLQKEFRDDGRYSDEIPKHGVDADFGNKKPLGVKTVAEAIAATVQK
jgi:arylsulfatase A-like enzyme